MKYKKFGQLDFAASLLGLGCMRLPTSDGLGFSPNIVEDKSIDLIRYAIDRGINYIDTGYPYHAGNSEIVLAKALKDGYRQKVKLATKSPMMMVRKPEDFDTFLAEQLKRLQADHIDFYLLHGIGHERWQAIKAMDIIGKAEAAIKDGRIGHLGFSFHDGPEAFTEIVNGYDKWEFCQVQYNYMDTENQAGTKGVKLAAAKGIPVIVMEPLLGGRLAKPPQTVQQIFDDCPVKRSPSDWALQWLWDQPEVTIILSGMGSREQVDENIASAERARVGSFSAEDKALIAKVKAAFLDRAVIPCTKCGYCMPCPSGVNIPGNLELYNNSVIYEDTNALKVVYLRFFNEKNRASACTACRACEAKCPQKIEISQWMPKVHGLLG